MRDATELEPDIDVAEKRAFVSALGTMIEIGTPIIRALEGVKNSVAQSQRMKDAIDLLILGIKQGHTLADALPKERFPEFDDGIFLPLIDAGEETGELDILLFKIGGIYAAELNSRPAFWLERSGALMRVSQLLQLYSDAGLPFLRSLKLIENSLPSAGYPQMAKAIGVVITTIESGATLSESLRTLPQFFPKSFVELVRIGEEQGAVDRVLGRINLH